MYCKMTTSALAMAVLTAGPAMADVTPAQVWENWIAYYQASGFTITEGARDTSGANLTLRDVTFVTEQDGAKVDFVIPSIALEDAGGGSVRVVLSDDFTGTATMTDPEDDEKVDLAFSGQQKGNEIIVSGTPEAQKYDVNMPEVVVQLDKVKGKDFDLSDVATFTMTDTTGSYTHETSDNGMKVSQALKTAKVALVSKFDVPKTEENDGGKVDVTAEVAGLDMDFDFLLPKGVTVQDLPAALKAGMTMEGRFTTGAYSGKGMIEGVEDGAPMTANFDWAVESSALGLTMNKEKLAYNGEAKASTFNMNVTDLPAPIRFGVGATSFDMAMPLMKSDAPQPGRFAYAIKELTLDDQVWAMIDPQATLPREPATLEIDVDGSALIKEDLLETKPSDPAMPMNEPFVPVDVKINRVLLDAVGALADVTGDLKIDPATQIPVGKINGNFEGLNGLMDKLVTMGLIQAEEVQGYRMMLAMFAKPVEGKEDALKTEIEFKEGGSIFANGVQVQ